MEKLLLSVQDVADRLGVGTSFVYALLKSGELPHIRFGRRYKVSIDTLRLWAMRQPLQLKRG